MQLYDSHPNAGIYEFIYPLIVGMLVGVFGRSPVWIVGPATMLCLPIGMVVNLIKDGGNSLNLWPVALMFYVVLAVLGLIGAALGRIAKSVWTKWIKRRAV